MAACVLSTAIGTARQTGWLGALIMVPCTAWVMRRRELPWAMIAGAWLLSVVAIFGSLRWFSHQMYSTAENAPMYKPGTGQGFETLMGSGRLLLEIAFFLAPVLFGFALEFFRGSRRTIVAALAVSALLCAFFLLRLHGYWASVLLVPPATGEGNYVTPHGILELPAFGVRPTVLSPFGASPRQHRLLLLRFCLRGRHRVASGLRGTGSIADARSSSDAERVPFRDLVVLLGSFAVVYCGMMAVRIIDGNLFDRYLLPLAAVVVVLAARFYQEKVSQRLPGAVLCGPAADRALQCRRGA